MSSSIPLSAGVACGRIPHRYRGDPPLWVATMEPPGTHATTGMCHGCATPPPRAIVASETPSTPLEAPCAPASCLLHRFSVCFQSFCFFRTGSAKPVQPAGRKTCRMVDRGGGDIGAPGVDMRRRSRLLLGHQPRTGPPIRALGPAVPLG